MTKPRLNGRPAAQVDLHLVFAGLSTGRGQRRRLWGEATRGRLYRHGRSSSNRAPAGREGGDAITAEPEHTSWVAMLRDRE